ncbi:unnamed protein product [Dicrocoelium dendriticum]|nr:unnamed protein product [Dicrocoelium dendriticum]
MSTEAVDTTVSDKAGTIDDFVKCRCRDLQSQAGHVDGSRPHLGCDLSDCPYLYLQRDNFTTEAFKIQLRNVRRYTGFKQLKKMLDGLGVKYRKIKLLQDVTFITFSCAEDRDKAISTLHEYKWRGQLLDARVAIGRADPLLQKRLPAFSETKETESKRIRTSSNDMTGNAEDPADRLRDIVTPLWRLRYDPDQLAEKRTRILSSLSSMRSSVLECNPKLGCRLTSSDVDRDVAGGLCICPLLETISSPVTVEYRNKSELTVGCDLDGNGYVDLLVQLVVSVGHKTCDLLWLPHPQCHAATSWSSNPFCSSYLRSNVVFWESRQLLCNHQQDIREPSRHFSTRL